MTSSPRKRSTATPTAASTSARLATSVCRKQALAPSSRTIVAPASSFRSATTTRAPSATKRRHVAAPMPEAPPVTTATFPSSRPMGALAREGVAEGGAGFGDRGLRLVHDRAHAEEAVDHAVVAVEPRRYAGRLQALRVRLALVAERIELGRDDERRGKPVEI